MKRHSYYFLLLVFLLSNCTQPKVITRSETVTSELEVTQAPQKIPTRQITPSPQIEPTVKPDHSKLFFEENFSEDKLGWKGQEGVLDVSNEGLVLGNPENLKLGEWQGILVEPKESIQIDGDCTFIIKIDKKVRFSGIFFKKWGDYYALIIGSGSRSEWPSGNAGLGLLNPSQRENPWEDLGEIESILTDSQDDISIKVVFIDNEVQVYINDIFINRRTNEIFKKTKDFGGFYVVNGDNFIVKEIKIFEPNQVTTKLPTIAPTPQLTPDEIKIISTIGDEDLLFFTQLSRITLEDFTSGKLLELERKWLDENPFPEKAIPFSDVKFNKLKYNFDMQNSYREGETTIIEFMQGNTNYSELETIPFKFISFYVLWDKELFDQLEFITKIGSTSNLKERIVGSGLGIVSWAFLNPDGTTTIGHTLDNLYGLAVMDDINEYLYFQTAETKLEYSSEYLSADRYINRIYEIFPELDPLVYSNIWQKTNIMPKELEGKLFVRGGLFSKWKIEN